MWCHRIIFVLDSSPVIKLMFGHEILSDGKREFQILCMLRMRGLRLLEEAIHIMALADAICSGPIYVLYCSQHKESLKKIEQNSNVLLIIRTFI